MTTNIQLLQTGQTVHSEDSGQAVTVHSFLGGGGQGEVYRAEWDGRPIALKWYFPSSATAEQRQTLETLIRLGAPDDRFLWPLELASAPGRRSFGYLMLLREPHYRNIVDLMKRRVEPSFRSLIRASRQLADSFFQLHARGLCYRDISFGNVFFDPDSGQVLICDNDNVTVDGSPLSGVLGTPRFMAPEIVRGEARPSSQTDLFSLSVLLFYMLMVSHPLEGRREAAIRCLDLPAMNRLYGTQPLFIFDPKNEDNAPVPGVHTNALAFWPVYPQYLRDLFTRAFTDGIQDPQNGRVRESEWRLALTTLEDWIVYCPTCGAENFYDPDALRRNANRLAPCWRCQGAVPLPFRMRLGKRVVMLNHDTRLYPHHLDENKLYDFSAPQAEVERSASDPQIWGLKNLTSTHWTLTTPEGQVKEVPPGKTVPLISKTRIQFGHLEGEVRF